MTVAVVASASLSAHRRDEFLQATRLALAPDEFRVEVDLTPGIAVAEGVVNGIDADGDGVFSADEQRTYVSRVLRAITLDVDGRPLQVSVTRSAFPANDAFERGEGTIRIEARAPTPMLAAGTHRVRFRNAHDPAVSVYLANALMPESDRVAITAQRRDDSQSELTIDFTLSRSSSGALDRGMPLVAAAGLVLMWGLLKYRARAPRRSTRAGASSR